MAFRLRDKQKVALRWAICFSLFLVSYLVLITPTFATGWMYISKTYKPSANMWGSYESPHGNFSEDSNKCRVCHALHKANQDSYRLLFDNSRQTECDRCHDPVTGLSGKKPYRLFSKYSVKKRHANYDRPDSGKNPEKPIIIEGEKRIVRSQDNLLSDPTPVANAKGEHTPGADYIPESNIDLPSSFSPGGLTCYSCHDPHFVPSRTIQSIPRWRHRGLLEDPAKNGGSADNGFGTGTASADEVKSAFCGDCHNRNVNWHSSPNSRESYDILSHPIGNVDGEVDIYGTWKPVVDASGSNKLTKSCMYCHTATTETDNSGNYTGPSSFPHQSVGHKLLSDSYTTDSPVPGFDYTGDPSRPLPNMDEGVCRVCHTKVGENSPQGF